MSIKENSLPIAESLNEGDKVRIVTNEGNSKQIDASEIGGGIKNLVDGSAQGSVRSIGARADDDSYKMGVLSSALGAQSEASEYCSYAEGIYCKSSGQGSHAEGISTNATGGASHAEGSGTNANGYNSHAEGNQTIAKYNAQHVFGRLNVEDPYTDATAGDYGKYVEIVGNGTSGDNRSNARTLDWSGNEKIAGALTLGMGTTDEVTITAAQLKQLLALLS